MKKFFVLAILISFFSVLYTSANKYYWVGNGGNWTDVSHHWATTSGGSVMQTQVPGAADTVYFDANSFSASGFSVNMDTLNAVCALMDWSGIDDNAEFISTNKASLKIYGSCLLSNLLSFNFLGNMEILAPAGIVARLNFQNISLKCNLSLAADSAVLQSALNLPYNTLAIKDGSLFTNGYNVKCRHFNTDSTLKASVLMVAPHWYSNDTLTVNGSMALASALDFRQNGPVYLDYNLIDTNYLNAYTNHFPGKLIVKGSKKMYLLNPMIANQGIEFNGSGKFYSRGYAINAPYLHSNTSLGRSIYLSSSTVRLSGSDQPLLMNSRGMYFRGDSAKLVFTYAGADTVKLVTGKDSVLRFKEIDLPAAVVLNYNTVRTGVLAFDSLTSLYLAGGTTLYLSSISSASGCGTYNYIQSFCSERPQSDFGTYCDTTRAIMNSSTAINASYFKLRNIKATGAVFTASNSFDEGNVSGWTITEASGPSALYWINGEGSWNDLQHWSATSGGSPAGCLPTRTTNVFFDTFSGLSNDTIFLNSYGYCKKMSWLGVGGHTYLKGKGGLVIADSAQLSSRVHMRAERGIHFNSSVAATHTFRSNASDLQCNLYVEGNGNWVMTDTLYIKGRMNLVKGTLTLNGQRLRCEALISGGSQTRTLNLSNSPVYLTGSDTAWRSNTTGLSITTTGSSVKLIHPGIEYMVVDAGGAAFDTLSFMSTKARLAGGTNCKLLKIIPGALLECEGYKTVNFDSLYAVGSCTMPISLSSYAGSSDTAIFRLNNINDTVIADYLNIRNVCATTGSGRKYYANSSTGINKYSGWTMGSPGAAKKYFWTGLSSQLWSNLNNWKVGAAVPTCLPTINDTVVFNHTHLSAPLSHDTVVVDKNAFCKAMIWTDTISGKPALLLKSELIAAGSVKLCDSLYVGYTGGYTSTNPQAPYLSLMPQSGRSDLDPVCKKFAINLNLQGKSVSDTIKLSRKLTLDTLCTLMITGGTFNANKKDIYAGVMASKGSSTKYVNISNCNINLAYSLDVADSLLTNFKTDSSRIVFEDNSSFYNLFDGKGKTFNYVEFNCRETGLNGVYYYAEIRNSNTTHIMKFEPGLRVQFRNGITQTLDSLIAKGSCKDSIYILTTRSGSQATLNKPAGDSIRGTCLNIKDLVATRGASALFSKNLGNNSKWFFSSKKPIRSQFTLPATLCYGDSTRFTNTSTIYSGIANDMSFHWYFGDNDSTSVISPAHLYNTASTYIVYLWSTDTASGCSDLLKDTITINSPNVNLSSSQADLTICAGENVTFTANSSNSNPDYQFMLSGNPVIQSPDSIHFTTNALVNGDNIYVILTYQGCVDTSANYTFTVNSLPAATLSSTDADLTICDGDSITFIASGADKYQFYVNGTAFGSYGTTSQWTLQAPSDGDELTLFAGNTSTGCSANSSDTLNVIVNDLPTVTLGASDPDLSICAGENVLFTAGGAAQYEFYLNSSSMGSYSPTNTLNLSTLDNGDVISVQGLSAEGCSSMSASVIEMTVLPTPQVSLICSDADGVICKGETVSFQSGGADTYQFSVNGDTTGAFDILNSFTSSSLSDGQVITVSGRLGVCEAASDTSIVMDVRPQLSWTYSANEICSYDSILFTAHGDVQYQYFIDGSAAGPAGPDSVFHALGLTNGQQVSVQGTAGSCNPSPLTISIHPVPVAPMICSEADTAICQGNLVSFTASGASQYAFYINGTPQGGFSATSSFSSTTLADGDVISMQALSSYGCLGTSPNTYTMEVRPYPVVSLSQDDADLTLCAGDTVNFNASGASLYQFFVNGASQGAASAASAFTTNGLIDGAVVSVSGTTGYCSATSATSFTYTVHPMPIVTFTALSPLNFCEGDTLSLLAGGASTYEFFVDGVSTGLPGGNNVFESTVMNSGETVSVNGYQYGCMSGGNVTYTVTVNSYPVVGFGSSIAGGGICYGDTITFAGSGAENYVFYLDNIPVSYDSVFITSELENGQVVTMEGGNGACWKNADSSIIVPVHYVNIALSCNPAEVAVCNGETVVFTASGADLYEFFVDGVSQGAPSASASFTSSGLTNGQIVRVEGSSTATGCTQANLADYMVHVFEQPVLTANPSATLCEGDSALLQSSVTEGLSWYLDGVQISGISSPSMFAGEAGSYSVNSMSGGDSSCMGAGAGFWGQLGSGNTADRLDFVEASGIHGALDVACGDEFTMILMSDGRVLTWGHNEFGALGTGNFTNSSVPVAAGNISNAKAIAAGKRFALAVLSDSTVQSWGENTNGQLGLGNYSTSNFPFAVSGLSGVVQVAAGDQFSMALTSDGKVWTWGQNQYGQLGDGSFTTRTTAAQVPGIDHVKAIRAGGNHAMALKDDGSLWVWGANNAGQLGSGDHIGSTSPVKVNLPVGIVSFDGGLAHSIAADSAGHVYTWGDNTYGQIGNGSTNPSLYPEKILTAGKAEIVRAGVYTSYVIRNDANVFSWGYNVNGQTGQGTQTNVPEPQPVNALFGIRALDAGFGHVQAISAIKHVCSSNNLILTVNTVPAVNINISGITLYTSTSGVSYQWYYNGNPIPAANDSSMLIGAHGVYYVEVTFAGGCTGISPVYDYFSGMEDTQAAQDFRIFPNPSNGEFNIEFAGQSLNSDEKITIIIRDLPGKIVYSKQISTADTQISVDLGSRATGSYMIEVMKGDQPPVRKMLVVQ
jgi:alpha-tubulin suppressor-like RCC1 family protein